MSGLVWVSRRDRLERAFIWDSSTEVDWEEEEEEEEGATPPPEERVAEREGCCRSAITSNNFSTLDERGRERRERRIESQSGTVLTEWGKIHDTQYLKNHVSTCMYTFICYGPKLTWKVPAKSSQVCEVRVSGEICSVYIQCEYTECVVEARG